MEQKDRLIIIGIMGLLILRLIAIAITPLGLDVEEAQYWLWSTTPDLGYFTKPPMIAWVIGLGTSLFGDSSFGIRAMAPIIQAASTLLIWRLGHDAVDAKTGRLAALIWMFAPISAIGGMIISTDSPMILFLLAAMVMLAPLARNQAISLRSALLAGIFTGLAMLSKYAAIYLPIGLLIWWLWQGRITRLVTIKSTALYGLGFFITILPNLVWNLNNGFVTAKHLGHNANLSEPHYSVLNSLEFIVAQAGIIGPVVFLAVIAALIKSRKSPEARFWLALFIPAILVIMVQAYFSDANANWAMASWPAGIILTASICARHNNWLRKLTMTGLAVNAGLAGVVLLAAMAGSFGPLTPASDPLRRLRGWDVHGQAVVAFAAQHKAEAIITTRRGTAAKLIWQIIDHGKSDGPINSLAVELIDANGIAENHFEQSHPWQAVQNRRIVLVNGAATPPDLPSVDWLNISLASTEQISKKRKRELFFHLGVER